MKQIYLAFIFIIILSTTAISTTYYPFTEYSIDNKTLRIILDGTKNDYDTDEALVTYNSQTKVIKNGSCSYVDVKEICYTGGTLDLEDDKGMYHRTYGQIPELYLTIEDQDADLSVTVTANQTQISPGDEFNLNISMSNEGNIDAKDIVTIINFDSDSVTEDYGRNSKLVSTGGRYRYSKGTLEENESDDIIFYFDTRNDLSDDITVNISTAYTNNGASASINSTETLSLVVPVSISFTISSTDFSVGDTVNPKLTLEKELSGVDFQNIRIIGSEGLRYEQSNKIPSSINNDARYIAYDNQENETIVINAIFTALYSGNHTIQSWVKYKQDNVVIENNKKLNITVSMDKPEFSLYMTETSGENTTDIDSFSNYKINSFVTNPSTSFYFKNFECSVTTPFVMQKTFSLSQLPRGGSEKIFSTLVTAPPVFEKKNHTLSLNCTYETEYNQSINNVKNINVVITPVNRTLTSVDEGKEKVDEIIHPTQTTTTSTTTTTLKKSFWQKIFGWLF